MKLSSKMMLVTVLLRIKHTMEEKRTVDLDVSIKVKIDPFHTERENFPDTQKEGFQKEVIEVLGVTSLGEEIVIDLKVVLFFLRGRGHPQGHATPNFSTDSKGSIIGLSNDIICFRFFLERQ